MKTIRIATFLAAACLAASAIASAVFAAPGHLADLAIATFRAAKNLVLDGLLLASQHAEVQRRPQVWFVQAKAFVARVVKRDRLLYGNSWRMVPSI